MRDVERMRALLRDMNHSSVARETGVTRATVSSFCRKGKPSLKTYFAIRKFFEKRGEVRRVIEGDGYTVRACMTCGNDFKSEGPHNRMCSHCRQKREGMI